MTTATYLIAGGALAVIARTFLIRLRLSRAKHPSLAGHARLAQWIARQVPFYALGEDRFFSADGAPEAVAARRRDGFRRLAQIFAERYPRSADLTEEVTGHISDLQFTGRYRVPFPFSSVVRRHLRGGAFVQASSGVTLTDLDGNRFYDLAGSYGVNVFGYDFYKGCIDRAAYTRWLRELREVCSECGIVLILDVSAWPWAGPRNISASAPTW